MTDREVLTWELFGHASRELAQTIADSGFVPEVVLGIARGGLLPAGALAYNLDCKALFTMNVEFYTGMGTTLDDPVILPPILDATELDGLSVLGGRRRRRQRTNPRTGPRILPRSRLRGPRTAVVYEKPTSVIRADYTGATPTNGSISPGRRCRPSRLARSTARPGHRIRPAPPPRRRRVRRCRRSPAAAGSSASAAGGYSGRGAATKTSPAAVAERIPFDESSMAAHLPGSAPSAAVACR